MKKLLLTIALISNICWADMLCSIENPETGEAYKVAVSTRGKCAKWFKENNDKSDFKCKGPCKLEVEDITEEIETRKAKRGKRKKEIKQIKAAINKIDASNKPNWEKKLLIRLVKELKE